MRRLPGRDVLKEGPSLGAWALALLAVLAAAYVAFASLEPRMGWTGPELRAARLMRDAEARVRRGRTELGWKADRDADPNETGMIGAEYGPYTTSLGNVLAKRTATDPRMAALLARLYREAGAKAGDVVAIGSSGSFPSLTIASIAAAKALDLRPVIVASIGASTWGSNIDGFTTVDLLRWLADSPVSGFTVAGVSLGGDDDIGSELDPDVRAAAEKSIRAAGYTYIAPESLRASVLERLALYDKAAAGRRIACYVNAGGNLANMGSGSDILDLQPGRVEVPTARVPIENRGVLHEMSLRGVPTIHLLNLKGLTARYDLPWDPSPLFNPDAPGREGDQAAAPLAAAIYLIFVILVVVAACLTRRLRRARLPAAETP